MSVSYPKGAQPTSSPGMKSAVPATMTPKKASTSAGAKGSSAYDHHGKVGEALKNGDHKSAASHTWRMMGAMRKEAKAATGPAATSAGFSTAAGTDEHPTPKPGNVRAVFGSLRNRGS